MDAPTDGSTPVPDTVDALSNPIRPHLLEALAKATTPVTTERLSRQIADRVARAGHDIDIERLQIALVHAHLPVLREADILRFDGEQVATGPEFERIRAVCQEVIGTIEG